MKYFYLFNDSFLLLNFVSHLLYKIINENLSFLLFKIMEEIIWTYEITKKNIKIKEFETITELEQFINNFMVLNNSIVRIL